MTTYTTNKNKLKVCLIYPGFPPEEDLGGGISVFCKMLVDTLVNLEVEIVVISRTQGDKELCELYRGIEVYRVPGDNKSSKFNLNGPQEFSKRVRGLIKKLESKTSSFDIIEAVDWGGEAIELLSEYKNRMIIRCHTPGFIAESYNPSNLPYLSEVSKKTEREVLLEAKHITSSSKILMSKIEKEIDHKLDYHTQPLMCADSPIKKKNYKKRFSKSNPMKIICAGRIEERKGYQNLVRALNELDLNKIHITMDIYGSTTPLKNNKNSGTELRRTISIKNRKKISINGKIDRNKLMKLYPKFDLCVVPSLFESWSLVGVEAIQCGLPTIISKTCELSSYLPANHIPLLFNATNLEDLINKIGYAYEHYDQCVEIAKEDQSWIQERFDPNRIGKEILQYYEKISNTNKKAD